MNCCGTKNANNKKASGRGTTKISNMRGYFFIIVLECSQRQGYFDAQIQCPYI
jgi:hypothetical protein